MARPRGADAPSVVALTFDDGPDPAWTPRVLDALGAVGAAATFFVVAEQIETGDGPALLRETIARGHEVQMHCGSHVSHRVLSRAQLECDAARIEEALAANGVPAPCLWRPPYGHVNERCSCGVAAQRSRRLVLWTHNTHDYTGVPAASMLRQAKQAPLYPDSVILLHDSRRYTRRSGDAAQTVALITPLVAYVREQGWEVGALHPPRAHRGQRAGEEPLLPC